MLFMDPPDHTRLRSLVNKAFTRPVINALEPRIRTIMSGLLDDIEDPSGFDLMKAVAIPLPVIVIAEMLGIPQQDRAHSGFGRISAPVCGTDADQVRTQSG